MFFHKELRQKNRNELSSVSLFLFFWVFFFFFCGHARLLLNSVGLCQLHQSNLTSESQLVCRNAVLSHHVTSVMYQDENQGFISSQWNGLCMVT